MIVAPSLWLLATLPPETKLFAYQKLAKLINREGGKKMSILGEINYHKWDDDGDAVNKSQTADSFRRLDPITSETKDGLVSHSYSQINFERGKNSFFELVNFFGRATRHVQSLLVNLKFARNFCLPTFHQSEFPKNFQYSQAHVFLA